MTRKERIMAEGTSSSWHEQEQPHGDGFTDAIKARATDVRSGLESFDGELRAFVKERPFVALVGAVLGGYMLARLIARR
jgi:hypothetical protein